MNQYFMSKKEIIWRYILEKTLKDKVNKFTQKDSADFFGFSTSTIFNALKGPRQIGAIEVTGRYFRLRDSEKLLLFWATHRNLEKEIIYTTHVDEPIVKIEGSMPPNITFGAFSAYRIKYNDTPADYGIIYIYTHQLNEIKKRFPKQKGFSNLVVLQSDQYLETFGQITPDSQTFVDLWNIPQWYSKDYLTALKIKMKL